jgi:hypothetical protein
MASAGSKSVLSDDMQELTQGKETISNSIQGHKANLSNPSTHRSLSPRPLPSEIQTLTRSV